LSWRCRVSCLGVHHPVRAPLFPYATLFRSEPAESRPTPAWDRTLVFSAAALTLLLVGATVGLLIGRSGSAPVDEDLKPSAVDIGDRKSTRLNSSHVKISYAVFCLKKKNMEK